MLNKELNESRFMEFEDMHVEDATSLGDENWSLWRKREGI